jgi:hypothetical protein
MLSSELLTDASANTNGHAEVVKQHSVAMAVGMLTRTLIFTTFAQELARKTTPGTYVKS